MGVYGIEVPTASAASQQQRNVIVTSRSGGELMNDVLQACEPTDVVRVGGSGNKVSVELVGRQIFYCHQLKCLVCFHALPEQNSLKMIIQSCRYHLFFSNLFYQIL